jgi:hypothetical protein
MLSVRRLLIGGAHNTVATISLDVVPTPYAFLRGWHRWRIHFFFRRRFIIDDVINWEDRQSHPEALRRGSLMLYSMSASEVVTRVYLKNRVTGKKADTTIDHSVWEDEI